MNGKALFNASFASRQVMLSRKPKNRPWLYYLSLGFLDEKVVKETTSGKYFLADLKALFEDLGISNAQRLYVDDQIVFLDKRGKEDDLAEAFALALRKHDLTVTGRFERLLLRVEQEANGCHFTLDFMFQHLHAPSEWPLAVELSAAPLANMSQEDFQKIFSLFKSLLRRQMSSFLHLAEVVEHPGLKPPAPAAYQPESPKPLAPQPSAPAQPAVPKLVPIGQSRELPYPESWLAVRAPTPEQIAVSQKLFPLYGITLGKTPEAELQRLGVRSKNNDTDGQPYKYYTIQGQNFWYENGVARHMYLVHTGAMPEQWRALGFDWNHSFRRWVEVLQGLGCSISFAKPPKTVPHYSGKHMSFEAELAAITPCESRYQIRLNFNYGNGTQVDDPDTLYSLSVRA